MMIMEYNFEKIGERIRSERKKKDWSQETLITELSAKNVTIHRNTLSDIENGCKKGTFSLPLLTALSELFNCEVGYLLCEFDCKTRRDTDVSNATGLTATAVDGLMNMSKQDLLVINTLIERGDIMLFRYALQNYYRKAHKTITISGIGEQSQLEAKESNKIFQYLSNEFIHDIFNGLVHDKKITNCFMRESVTEYWKTFESVIEENNALYEQTEERKEFMKKNKEFIQQEIRKNEATDYYEEFSKK